MLTHLDLFPGAQHSVNSIDQTGLVMLEAQVDNGIVDLLSFNGNHGVHKGNGSLLLRIECRLRTTFSKVILPLAVLQLFFFVTMDFHRLQQPRRIKIQVDKSELAWPA